MFYWFELDREKVWQFNCANVKKEKFNHTKLPADLLKSGITWLIIGQDKNPVLHEKVNEKEKKEQNSISIT